MSRLSVAVVGVVCLGVGLFAGVLIGSIRTPNQRRLGEQLDAASAAAESQRAEAIAARSSADQAQAAAQRWQRAAEEAQAQVAKLQAAVQPAPAAVVAHPAGSDEVVGLAVSLVGAELGRFRGSAEVHLVVGVRVRNPSETRQILYAGGGYDAFLRGGATLTDEFGNDYHRYSGSMFDDADPRINVKKLNPGESIEDVYVFERPVLRATKATFTIPPDAIKAQRPFVVTIDLSKLARP